VLTLRRRPFSYHTAWEDWWCLLNTYSSNVEYAIIDAYNDVPYEKILGNFQAILFLATPHRGANFAGLSSNLLSAAFSHRVFVEQLRYDSELMEINNFQFRDRTRSLELVSFSESTAIRGLGVCIAEVQCYVSGYCEPTVGCNWTSWREVRPIIWEPYGDFKVQFGRRSQLHHNFRAHIADQ
jgi:hypothetical protein